MATKEKKGRDREKIARAFYKAKAEFEDAVKARFRPRGASNFRSVMERFSLQPSKVADRAMPYAERELGPAAFAKYKKAYRAARLLFRAIDREKYHRNPAPGLTERSARLHRMRASLLTKLQIARRKGNMVQEQDLSRKLLKLDRLIYAPRPKFFENQAKRYKKNPITYYYVCVEGRDKAYARIIRDRHDEPMEVRLTPSISDATMTQSLSAARRWAQEIARHTNKSVSVETR